MTSQAPHAHRTLFAIVAGLPEHQIRIISPDIGGGFGNKVPIYPGYVVATAASLLIGRAGEVDRGPHREPDLDRLRPRLPHARRAGGEGRPDDRAARQAAVRQRRLLRRRTADASSRPGLFHIVTGSYDIPAAHVVADGAYTNKAPGGVAYRCSFRVTEASYLIERLVQTAAYELGHRPGRVPAAATSSSRTSSPTRRRPGFVYDSGDYEAAMELALEKLGYDELRARAGGGPRGGPADRDRGRLVHRGRRGRQRARTTTSPACACSTRPSCASTRPARRSSSSA